jgi:TonB family protein
MNKIPYLLLFCTFLLAHCSFLGNAPITEASFPGGEDALGQYVVNHLRYPADGQNKEGTVLLRFVVEKDGQISQPEVVESVSPALDREAMKILDNMPSWEPGRRGSKAVRTTVTLPVQFIIKQ